ncbi:MAG TPA: GNAT family N-acetyltransferase [Devosiaceae bacterium]|jgi:hypothetical protein
MSVGISENAASVAATPSHAAIAVGFVTDAAIWADLIGRAPFPHLPQSFAYGEGKRAKGWTVRRAVFREDDRVIAFATVLERRIAGIRIVTRINRGPIFLDATPSPERIIAVYKALRRRWRGPLLIGPALEAGEASSAQLRAAGFRLRQEQGWLSGRIDLRPDEQKLWAGLASTFRNRVRNSEKAGATLRIGSDAETYEWMLARHADNMRDKHFSAVDATLLRAMRAAAPQDVLIFQLVHDGEPVAGMSVVRFGSKAEYHIGWFGPEGRKLNAGNFLMWEILKELRRRGTTDFDVGGMRPGDGYTRFKRTMHPAEFQLAGEWMSF